MLSARAAASPSSSGAVAADPAAGDKTAASGPRRTAVVQDGKKKVQTIYPDGQTIVEEFSLVDDELLVRRIRKRDAIGRDLGWEYEVGEPPRKPGESDLLKESDTTPFLVRKDSRTHFQWRIRNLPYPRDVYQLTVEGNMIVVRTTNKKYFKKIGVPDMERAGIHLAQESLSTDHQNRTLIISYRKPQLILQREEVERIERASLKLEGQQKEGDIECKQS